MLLICLAAISTVHAAGEGYEYDPAGRLGRIVADGGNSITRYTYDAMGNLVSVRVVHREFPPTVLSVEPDTVRAGGSEGILVTGANLAGASLISPGTALEITDLSTDPDTLSFLLSLAKDTPSGAHTFRVRNPDGEATFMLEVLPPLPLLSVAPLPLALPEDGSLRHFLVRLSHADVVERSIALSLSDTSVAALETGEITMPVGTTEVRAGIRGLAGGISTLTLASTGLEARTYSVYVTADYGAINSKFSVLLGVMVGESQGPIGSLYSGWSDALGLLLGPYIEAIDPGALGIGSAAVPLTVHGAGLASVDSLSIQPQDGISVSAPGPAPDEKSVRLFATVAANAAFGLRRVVLDGADGPYPAARPGADLVNITHPLPELDSVSPNYGVRGSTGLGLTLRGRNLNQASALAFDLPDGIVVGSSLQTNTGGTSLTATLSIAPDAPTGDRLVTVTTPAGSSGTLATAANTFRVVNQVTAIYRPIAASLLGVQVGEDSGKQPLGLTTYGPGLGVVLGPMARGLSPNNAVKGTSTTLSISGIGLDAVTSAAFSPATGTTIDGMTASAGSETLTLGISLAPDAPETWRRLRLFRDAADIPFGDPRAALFLVTGPIPQVESIGPNTLKIGAGPRTIALRGRNFDRATAVSALPPDDLVIGSPTVSSGGASLSVSIEAQTTATSGLRVLTVTTPAGNSTQTPSPANTLTLYAQALAAPAPLIGPLLGVTVGEPAGSELTVSALPSPLLGIQVGEDAPIAPGTVAALASHALGIVTGVYATDLEAPPLLLGDTYTLSVRGHGLDLVDGAGVFPGLDLVLGTPVPAADGASLLLSLTVPPDAAVERRELRLVAGDTLVPFADPALALLEIAPGVPEIDSLTPIVIRPGETAELIVRGSHLQNARRVFAEPAHGILFASTLSATGDGSEVRVRIHAQDDAPLGARTIRIETPGGTSTDQALPANTLTLF